jgi:4-amino-4-deoxy-L-arabinose transferase-like glycosyltransferase
MLLAYRGGTRNAVIAGACLGLAVLAKGLVPLVLAAPLVIRRKRWFDLLTVGAACVAVAAPWYWLCYARNGQEFVNEFLWKHHFGRFVSTELQHVQPWWYYVPVLLAAIFPWTPVLFTMPGSKNRDPFRLFLIAWVIWGFVFFSASKNKLPGYLLPLLPPLLILLAMRLSELKNARWVLSACALLLAAIPFVSDILPLAMINGLLKTQLPARDWFFVIPALLLAAQSWKLEALGRRMDALQVLILVLAASILFLKIAMFPRLDALASSRSIWRRVADRQVCVEDIHRSWLYGLNYYAQKQLPKCEPNTPGAHLIPGTTSRPVIVDRVVLP